MPKIYKNTSRKTGTQKELPNLTITKDNIDVGGYQRFTITKNDVIPVSYSGKFTFLKQWLAKHSSSCDSIADLGCSNGLVCFAAHKLGYIFIYALDHDEDCLNLIKTISDKLYCTNIVIQKYSFGDTIDKCDIVIMCALIHWIYSCTALYGSFDKIFEYLKQIVGKYLIIEWVNPNDPAIKMFKHTQFNKEIIKESYTKDNFLKSIKKYFNTVEKIYQVNGSRELYLATI